MTQGQECGLNLFIIGQLLFADDLHRTFILPMAMHCTDVKYSLRAGSMVVHSSSCARCSPDSHPISLPSGLASWVIVCPSPLLDLKSRAEDAMLPQSCSLTERHPSRVQLLPSDMPFGGICLSCSCTLDHRASKNDAGKLCCPWNSEALIDAVNLEAAMCLDYPAAAASLFANR